MTGAAARGSPVRRRKARALRPRDAATLIIVDQSSGEPRVLLGRRRLDMAFMPGRYVFPGGRVDPADKHIAVEDDLEPGDLKKLHGGHEGHAERGPGPGAWRWPPCARPSRRRACHRRAAGRGGRSRRHRRGRTSLHTGYRPALARLTFFARAITPPGRPRRFDSRFFCVPAEAIVHRVKIADGELSDLEWHSIAQARSLELPNITRVVLEDLGERIAAGALHTSDLPVPFYHRRNGSFRRDLIGGDVDLD